MSTPEQWQQIGDLVHALRNERRIKHNLDYSILPLPNGRFVITARYPYGESIRETVRFMGFPATILEIDDV